MKKQCVSVLLISILAVYSTVTFADETTTTVSFIAPVDVQSCIITPILLDSYSSESDSDSSALSSAEVETLAQVLGSVQAIATGSVDLVITRNGKHGSVNTAEFSGRMGNSYLAAASVKTNASVETSVDTSVNADAYTIASTVADSSWDFRPLDIDFGVELGTEKSHAGVDFEAYAGVRGGGTSSGSAESQAESEADSATESQTDSSAEINSDVSSSNEATAHISIEGANIDKLEANLSMTGAVLHSFSAEAIAEVLADAYARSYVEALAESSTSADSTAAEFYAHVYSDLYLHLHRFNLEWSTNLIDWNPTWTFGEDYDDASDEDRETLRAEFRVLADGQAEAIVDFLASAELSVNLGVRFEDLPGTEDLLEATGDTSAVLTCDISQSFSSTTTAAQTQP